MSQDVPQFMQTMVEQDQGNDVLEPLRNDILTDDELLESKDEPKTEVQPVDTDNKSEATESDDTKKADKPGETTKPEDKPVEKTDEQSTVPSEDASKKEVPPNNAKIIEKTAEQIEAVAQGQGNEKLKQAIELANKFQLVNVEMPKSKDFVLDDGSIDLDSYGKTLVNNTIMALQKSLVGGPLSAALYGVLNTAMTEEQAIAAADKEATEYAQGIYDNLIKNFPILSTDKEIEEAFDSMLQGENLKRAKLAEQMAKEGKTLPRMTYDDYEKLLIRLVGKRNTEPTKEEIDPVETMKGGITMNGGTGAQDSGSSDPDIDAMMRVKSKSLFE